MSALARAGWALSALFFATLLASLAHVDYVGLAPLLLLLSFAILAAIRPTAAIDILAAAIPVAWYVFVRRWNASVPWAEALVCAALAGLSARAALDGRGGVPFVLRAPAILFGVVVAGSMIAALGVPALRLGPGFREALSTQILREYFVDVRGFPALHAGVLLLEGVLLLALAARFAAGRPDALRRVAAMTAAGAAFAAALNMAKLIESASRADTFWPALATLSQTIRWNVHYADFNAAGSYFAMALLAAAGLAAVSRTWSGERILWVVCGLVVAGGLWLTASRAAYLALILALAGAAGAIWIHRSGRRLVALTGVAAAAVAIIAVIAVAAPMRGNQHSPSVAAGVRLGMARVAVQMVLSRPAFGIGLGQFYQRSGEFATPDLIASFPVAVHENAHNNFLQIAAELGLPGGLLFMWLVCGALLLAARAAAADRLRLFVVAGLGAFVITWLGGHPLLVPEAAYAFWLLLGIAAGSAQLPARAPSAHRWIVAACAIAIAATVPWRMRTLMQDAELEHIGVGVSVWQTSPDGIRYREGDGQATLFVPTGAFKFSVNPRTDAPVRLEVKLDGRVADIVALAPGVWNDLALPARSERTAARYAAVELRVLDGDRIRMWITKVEPIR